MWDVRAGPHGYAFRTATDSLDWPTGRPSLTSTSFDFCHLFIAAASRRSLTEEVHLSQLTVTNS